MKVGLAHQFRTLRGSYKTTDLVLVSSAYTGEVYARAKVRPKNPQTKDQVAAREIGGAAARCWSGLSASVRADWQRFTERFACTAKRRRAMDVCREAQRMRLILGLPTTTEAPRHGYPGPVTELALEPATDPTEFSFRIEHAAESPAGHMVLVKITQPMPTSACTPQQPHARAICGLGPQSAVALPQSPGVVSFSNARFAIEPGSRFGAVLTVIRTEDGLASPPAFFDLIRA